MLFRSVTSFFQKYYDPKTPHPDFWVIVHINFKSENLETHFYVLTHEEIAAEQRCINKMEVNEWKRINGVDNIPIKNLEKYIDKWDKIEAIKELK